MFSNSKQWNTPTGGVRPWPSYLRRHTRTQTQTYTVYGKKYNMPIGFLKTKKGRLWTLTHRVAGHIFGGRWFRDIQLLPDCVTASNIWSIHLFQIELCVQNGMWVYSNFFGGIWFLLLMYTSRSQVHNHDLGKYSVSYWLQYTNSYNPQIVWPNAR